MHTQMMDQILHKVQSIPSLPAAAQRLCQLAQDPEADEGDIIRAITTDEVLTSRILRAANSAIYGLSQKITTVSHAIVILGHQTIRNLALGVTVFGARMGTDREHSLHREDLWRHSLAVASAAREMAKLLRDPDSEETFTAGLLHDIGQVVLIEFFHEVYAPVLEQAAQGAGPLHILEQQAFGIDHAAIGREICRHWKIPPSLEQAVSEHHHDLQLGCLLTRENRRLFEIRVGDNLARISQIGSDGEANVEMDFLRILDTEEILPEHLRKILLALPEEVRKAEIFFDLVSSHDGDRPHHSPSDTAGVYLADRNEREVVRLLLLSLGYTLIPIGEMRTHDGPLAGVVVDESLPVDLKELFQQRGTPLMDFDVWRGQRSGGNQPVQINIQHLRVWLGENLPHPQGGAASP